MHRQVDPFSLLTDSFKMSIIDSSSEGREGGKNSETEKECLGKKRQNSFHF